MFIKKIKTLFALPAEQRNFLLDRDYGIGKLERFLNVKWYNPLLSLWVNFRSFPLRQAWKLPFSVYGWPKFYGLSGSMRVEGKVSFGMIRFNLSAPGRPGISAANTQMLNNGTIIFHGKIEIGTGSLITVRSNSTLEFGADVLITDNVNIGCSNYIVIGDYSRVVHRCQVFDSSYHYVANFAKGIVPPVYKEVHIGKNCWVCNSSTINGGTVLPDNTIVASNSVVSKDFSNAGDSPLIGGIPAKVIANGLRRIYNPSYIAEVSRFYSLHPTELFQIPLGGGGGYPPTWSEEECSRR
jgi:acetyltransferase-like isoleucine patch superfamily enzyme